MIDRAPGVNNSRKEVRNMSQQDIVRDALAS